MRLLVVAVGQKIPSWAQNAWDDYAKRFPPELRLELKAVKTEPRTSGRTSEQCKHLEAARIEQSCPRGVYKVVLDERGERLSTTALAERLRGWCLGAKDVALIIGGPDGLDPVLKDSAQEHIRLSDLTLPHAFVRVMLAEALYRAWSYNAGHPYHRE